MYDEFCTTICNSPEYKCNWDQCLCEEHEFPVGAPIEPEPALTLTAPRKMKPKAPNLVEQVLRRGERHLYNVLQPSAKSWKMQNANAHRSNNGNLLRSNMQTGL